MRPSAALAGGRLRVVFASLTPTLNIWSLPLDEGRPRSGAVQPAQVTSGAYDAQLTASADGRRLAFVSSRGGNKDIWWKDLATGREMPLISAPGDQFGPILSDDGARLAYQTYETGQRSQYLVSLSSGPDGAVQPTPPEKLCSGCLRLWDLSSDAARFLELHAPAPRITLGLLNRATGQSALWLEHPEFSIARVRFSHDDRWISFLTLRGDRGRVYVAPFRPEAGPKPDEWIAITGQDTFHDKPEWSPDGALLYYTSDRDGLLCIYAQRLDPASRRPVGTAMEVYHSHSARRSIMNANIIEHDVAVTRDKLLFHLGEVTGNIWMK